MQSIIDYQKITNEIRKHLSVDENVNPALVLGSHPEQYLVPLRDAKPPSEWELDIWSSLVSKERQRMTGERLKKKALSTLFFYIGYVGLLGVALTAVAVLVIGHMPTGFGLFGILLLLLAALATFSLWQFGTTLIQSYKNYLALDGLLQDRAIFTISDLQLTAIQTMRDGIGQTSSRTPSVLLEQESAQVISSIVVRPLLFPRRPTKEWSRSSAFLRRILSRYPRDTSSIQESMFRLFRPSYCPRVVVMLPPSKLPSYHLRS